VCKRCGQIETDDGQTDIDREEDRKQDTTVREGEKLEERDSQKDRPGDREERKTSKCWRANDTGWTCAPATALWCSVNQASAPKRIDETALFWARVRPLSRPEQRPRKRTGTRPFPFTFSPPPCSTVSISPRVHCCAAPSPSPAHGRVSAH
jgi:hypothetical protein